MPDNDAEQLYYSDRRNKKIAFILLLIFICVIAIVIVISVVEKDSIVGTWVYDYYDYYGNKEPEPKAEEELKTWKLTMNETGTFSLEIDSLLTSKEKSINGTYEVNDQNVKLIVDGDALNAQYTNGKLIIDNEIEEMKMVFKKK